MPKPTITEITFASASLSLAAGVGTAAVAYARNSRIGRSAAIFGAGTGLLSGAVGFFMEKKEQPQPASLSDMAVTALFYEGIPLSLSWALGINLFADAVLGFPISLGLLVLIDTLEQCAQNSCSQFVSTRLSP